MLPEPLQVPFSLPDLGCGPWAVVATTWLAPVGGRVIEGDRLLEVTVGDAVVDLPAPASGRLVQKCVREDETLSVGQLLGVIELEIRPEQ